MTRLARPVDIRQLQAVDLVMAPRKLGDVLEDGEAVSRTYHYRKVEKPKLEKKRRDLTNSYIDKLREIIFVLPGDRESSAKMEKNKILEHTIKYIGYLQQRQHSLIRNQAVEMERFRTYCAAEVNKCLASHGVQISNNSRFLSPPHPGTEPVSTIPQPSLRLSTSSDAGYESGRDQTPSPALSLSSPTASTSSSSSENVWRPF